MNDYLVLFFQIIIAILLVIFPAMVLNLDRHYWLVGIMFVVVFYLIQCSLSVDVFNRAFTSWELPSVFRRENMTADGNARQAKVSQLGGQGVLVEDGVFGDQTENYYGTKIPLMGPYDGIRPADITKKLSTSEYQKTAYPYRPITHFGTMTPDDSATGQKLLDTHTSEVAGVWYKQDVERWYPNTNSLATNTRDCTNYPAGHPGSCLINPERIPGTPVALATLNGYSVDGGLLDAELSAKEDKFTDIASTPKLLKSGESWPILFKNAPGNLQFDTGTNPPYILPSNDLCRTCKIGTCMKAYCGSRQIESGTDNIINPAGYMADFLRDIALV